MIGLFLWALIVGFGFCAGFPFKGLAVASLVILAIFRMLAKQQGGRFTPPRGTRSISRGARSAPPHNR